MNLDMENLPEAEEYIDEDGTMGWLDAQQMLLRGAGYMFLQISQQSWVNSAEGYFNAIMDPVDALIPVINICDPQNYEVDQEDVLEYVDSESRALKLIQTPKSYIENVVSYKSGLSNPFDDELLPSLLRSQSSAFLSRLMEFQIGHSIIEQFVHSLRILESAFKFSHELNEWTLPTPSVDAQSVVAKPAPQPYGVSHEGAEILVRDWMLYLGIPSAEVTRFTSDGGIDVVSTTYVAQVKNYKDFVGVQAVREILGVAIADEKKPLFFTSGSYTSEALNFAERAKIPLFTYDAAEGTLARTNSHAEEIFRQRLNVSEDELAEEVQSIVFRLRLYTMALRGVMKSSSRIVRSLFPSKEQEVNRFKESVEQIDCADAVAEFKSDSELANYDQCVARFESLKIEFMELLELGKLLLDLGDAEREAGETN